MPLRHFRDVLSQQLRKDRRGHKGPRRSHQSEAMEPRLLLAAVADLNPDVDQNFTGSQRGDTFRLGSGMQQVMAGRGNDRIISIGDAGEPDPARRQCQHNRRHHSTGRLVRRQSHGAHRND